MNENIQQLAAANRHKATRALNLLAASLTDFQIFDPTAAYTPKELEPYDALADRFVRAVECALRFMRSVEMQEYAEQSDSTRSLLLRMEKLGMVSNTDLWLSMRNVRNRIVHDYLPEQTAQMFSEISQVYGPELIRLREELEN